jgi:hypothetical protein
MQLLYHVRQCLTGDVKQNGFGKPAVELTALLENSSELLPIYSPIRRLHPANEYHGRQDTMILRGAAEQPFANAGFSIFPMLAMCGY